VRRFEKISEGLRRFQFKRVIKKGPRGIFGKMQKVWRRCTARIWRGVRRFAQRAHWERAQTPNRSLRSI